MPPRLAIHRPPQDTATDHPDPKDDAMPKDASAPIATASGKPDWAMSRREIERVLRERAGLPPVRRKWPWVILALVLIAAAGGFGYWRMQQMTAAPEVVAEPVVEVAPEDVVMEVNSAEYAVLAPLTLERVIRVTGTIQPARQAQLSSQAGGRVEEVAVQPGDRVSEGDLLVQVDVQNLTIQLDLARSNAEATQVQLGLAETQLERSEALLDRGVATTSTIDEARSNVQALRANLSAQQDQVRSAELQLANATLRAPFDGIVSTRSADPGQYVQVGAPLVTVVDLTTVEMQANAPAAAGAVLRPGQPVTVTVDGLEGRTFDGEVTRINPVAAEGTRTIPVYIRIENEDGVLLGGMFATGQVVTAQADAALAIPTEALREDADGVHVLRIADGRLERAAVETGGTWAGGLTRIDGGLSAGDTVITAPLAELDPGDAVTLVEE
ncbi:RND transporter [Wenxinia marina]|uniref:RND family efflux transporter, MFP subunit n=2 Tax=Wenxinia TaxID=653686 RepID=A0A0D0NLV3_9RHOB|nr:RND family efflux transporter, MFP subunit [Wenxinia marina DSM 24838]GGL71428.1 RND transporter [Wenxinia marina]